MNTNRRRYAVGASHVLKQVAVWVEDAVRHENDEAEESVESVVVTSSKALLLVTDPQVGRRIIRAVTHRAVREAPGLDIWGYVEPTPERGDPMARIDQVHTAADQQRWRRAVPAMRAPMAPFLAGCQYTGRAATALTKRGDDQILTSAQAEAIVKQEIQARAEMQALVPDHPDVIASTANGEELINAGWVAVIHADGNSVGSVISSITDTDQLARFSRALEVCTKAAFRQAVNEVVAGYAVKDEHTEPDPAETLTQGVRPLPKEWLLPLIVGGDDITVACDARMAVAFTRAYLTRFEAVTAINKNITEAAEGHLTASAGIAVIKPKYPYSSAYALAESLAHNAKRAVKEPANVASHRSSYDLHILRDSIMADLSRMRAEKAEHTTSDGSVRSISLVGPWLAPAHEPKSEGSWAVAHEDQPVIEQVRRMQSSDLRPSASESRRLKRAVRGGGEAMERERTRLVARAIDAGEDPFLLDDAQAPTLTRWPMVLDLLDLNQGTATARTRS